MVFARTTRPRMPRIARADALGHSPCSALRELSIRPNLTRSVSVLGITGDTLPGFVPIAKRWVVEQTNDTLMLHRRLVREYESRPESSVSRTLWASAANLVRRLTGTSTPTWRAPA